MKKAIHHQFSLEESHTGMRLDQALVQLLPEYSRNQFKYWIEAGDVSINGEISKKPKHKVMAGDAVELNAELSAREDWSAQDIPLTIVFEDESFLIINKPPDLVVHPGAGVHSGTLVNALLNYDVSLEALPRAGLIHRLDKDTSGLLVVARNLASYNTLNNMMKERQIHRQYKALIHGRIIRGGTVNLPIARDRNNRTRMSISEGGRESVTHYEVAQRFTHHTLLNVTLETGRTHQIRIHFAHLRHPIVGDSTYGGKRPPQKELSEAAKEAIIQFNRQALHAEKLSFIHPNTNEEVAFEAPLPEDYLYLISKLGD